MKKYLSILSAVAVAAAMVACEKDGNGDANKVDVNDPSTVQTEHLVAYFPLESEAKAVELGKDITFSKKGGSAAFVEGVRGKAYANSAADCKVFSYLDFKLGANNPFKTMSSFTMSAWVKSPVPNDGSPAMLSINAGDGGMGSLLVMYEGWGCNTDSLFVKSYLFNTRTEWKGQDLGLSNVAFTTDKWFHLVYSYNEATSMMTLYSNGQFVAESGRWAGPEVDGKQEGLGKLILDPAMSNLYIGAWWNNLDGTHADAWRSSYPGSVDEIRFWDIALTPEEIEDLYTKEVTKADKL